MYLLAHMHTYKYVVTLKYHTMHIYNIIYETTFYPPKSRTRVRPAASYHLCRRDRCIIIITQSLLSANINDPSYLKLVTRQSNNK